MRPAMLTPQQLAEQAELRRVLLQTLNEALQSTALNATFLETPPASALAPYAAPRPPPAKDIDWRWVPYLVGRYVAVRGIPGSYIASGSYGACFAVVRAQQQQQDQQQQDQQQNQEEPEQFVLKCINKARVTNNATQVQHLIIELIVNGVIDHPRVNKRIALFHSDEHILIVLKRTHAPRPSVQTRLAHFLAYRFPLEIRDIDLHIERLRADATRAGIDPDDELAFGDFVDERRLIQTFFQNQEELPHSTDLFFYISNYRRLPDPVCQVLLRQILEGVHHLHQHGIVHRDIKSENVIVGVDRRALVRRDPASNAVVGVTIYDRYDAQLIDFGLVKAMFIDGVEHAGEYARRLEELKRRRAERIANALTPPGSMSLAGGGAAATAALASDGSSNSNNGSLQPQPAQADAAPESGGAAGGAANTGGAPMKNDTPATGSSGSDDNQQQNNNNDPFAAHVRGDRALQPPKPAPKTGDWGDNELVVTSCGTDTAASLEHLLGILPRDARPQSSYRSTSLTLPLLDVFGVGTIAYSCAVGRPPFRPPETYRRISREQRLRIIQGLVEAGPQFEENDGVTHEMQRFICRLLDNDVALRPNARAALKDPFVRAASRFNVVMISVDVDGTALMQLVPDFPPELGGGGGSGGAGGGASAGGGGGAEAKADDGSAAARDSASGRGGARSKSDRSGRRGGGGGAEAGDARARRASTQRGQDGALSSGEHGESKQKRAQQRGRANVPQQREQQQQQEHLQQFQPEAERLLDEQAPRRRSPAASSALRANSAAMPTASSLGLAPTAAAAFADAPAPPPAVAAAGPAPQRARTDEPLSLFAATQQRQQRLPTADDAFIQHVSSNAEVVDAEDDEDESSNDGSASSSADGYASPVCSLQRVYTAAASPDVVDNGQQAVRAGGGAAAAPPAAPGAAGDDGAGEVEVGSDAAVGHADAVEELNTYMRLIEDDGDAEGKGRSSTNSP